MLKPLPKVEPVYVAIALCAIGWLIIIYVYMIPDKEEWYRDARQNAIQFQSVDLNGRIRYINNKGGFIMQGINEPLYYGVKIEFAKPNQNRTFQSVAKPGDSLIKHAYADSLILFTNHNVYHAKCTSILLDTIL